MLTKNHCLVIKLYHIGSSSAETELPEITEDNTLKIILGIDTGGTYTDAVACNSETYEIYVEAKSLTTRQDLSVGIHNALAQLPQEYLTQAEMVSLSTTLTTNACVENVITVWKDSAKDKAAQLVFCDLSTPKGDGEYNVYEDLRDKLIEKGIPANEIAFIHDANTEIRSTVEGYPRTWLTSFVYII